jgi:hypothetical protein
MQIRWLWKVEATMEIKFVIIIDLCTI